MPDQAAALRQLKEMMDRQVAEQTPSGESYLATLPTTTPFTTILLLMPEEQSQSLPPMQKWLPRFFQNPRKACLWDEGGFLPARLALGEQPGTNVLSPMQQIETPHGPGWVIPRFGRLGSLSGESESDRIRFLRQAQHSLSTIQELWITLSMSEVYERHPVVASADLAAIMLPFHPNSLLRGYEIVKTLHLAKFPNPIGVLVEQAGAGHSTEDLFQRLQATAKRFLSLDLQFGGVVHSHERLDADIPATPLQTMISASSPLPRTFLTQFADHLLFPHPNLTGGNHG